MFRTKSTLSKQNSFMLPLRKDSGVNQFHKNGEEGVGLLDETFDKSVPAGRYFAALTGPELDQVKCTEDILLPKDKKWPFLLRFPIGFKSIVNWTGTNELFSYLVAGTALESPTFPITRS
ncbi:guard cell S-type anion channel SLAC1 [Tanacetum coccineum]